jgi:hypothetical protein
MWEKIFFLLSIFIIFYISIRSLQNFSFEDDILKDFISQFNQNYIQDIQILNTHTPEGIPIPCPDDYEELLTNYYWAGNFNGCGCKNSYNTYDYYPNICPEENCINIEEIEPRNFSNYNHIHFCYKRGKKNYGNLIFNLLPSESYNLCQNETHRVCGFIDSLKNIICLPKNETCPMLTTFLISKDKKYIENYKKKYDNDAEIINITNAPLYILKSHSPLNIATTWKGDYDYNIKIYNNFRVDLSQPCLGGKSSPKSELIFDLMKNKYEISCDTYKNGTEMTDNLYTILDQENYLDYLADNDFLELNDKLFKPFEIDLSNKNIKLYAKSYPGWSSMCYKESPDTFFNFLNSSTVLNKISFMTIINSFLIIILLISIGIGAFYFIEHFEKIFYIIVLCFLILNLFYPLQLIANSNWIINNLSDNEGNFCGDESLNIIIKKISDSCQTLIYSYTFILCITILDIIIFIYVMQSLIKPAIKELQEKLIQLRELT